MNGTSNPRGFREEPKHTSRKEDYKSYTERDDEDGWPYSDEPGTEEERLKGNRAYGSDEEAEALGTDGFHLETAEVSEVEGPEVDETVQEYIDAEKDEDGDEESAVENRR